ncbi:MAG: toxic anion resistance protein [Clostridia bacterium]|nr:toxic anion resistance protein [Clostridia bacterium]
MEEKKFEGEMPTLVFDETATATAEAPVEEVKPEVEPVELEETLSAEEMKVVDSFAEKIDITNSAAILQYGASAQQKIAEFSESALAGVKTKDLGEVSDMITDLTLKLKEFTTEEKKGCFDFFKKSRSKIEALKLRYSSAEKAVDGIVESLENHQIVLMKDIAMLDKMYDMNLQYFKELTMYIAAGKKKLKEERETKLAELKAKAEKTQAAEDAQAANDFENQCLRFERKLHDLELTRTICMQMAPQIRLVQNNNTIMTEKIQSVIVSTIPLWKNQMLLALGIQHSTEAMEAQRAVTDMTNELLRRNAETLKQGTIDIAKESERGIVEMETLQYTNQQLIETLDEVQKIQSEGKAKRAEAERELARIEGELRSKLLNNK